MLRNLMKTTSILAIALGTSVPTLAAAQTADTDTATEVTTEASGDTATETTSDGTETEVTTETDATVETEVETDGDMAAEGEVEMDGEMSVEGEVEMDGEVAVEGDGEMQVEGEMTADPDATLETDATIEGGPEGEVIVEEGTETEMEAETDAEVTAEGDMDAEPELQEMDPQAQIDALQQQLDQLKQSAAASADSTGEVVTETVTEETARSSSEEFETSATGEASVSGDSDDDDGLSNFEKAAIAGLGALVVGTILDNGAEVVSNSGDRVVLERDGQYYVLKDDNALLRQPGYQVATENFDDGSSRVTVNRPDGNQVITVRAADGTVLRRTVVRADGTEVVLFDDTQIEGAVDVADLNLPERRAADYRSMNAEELRVFLAEQEPAIDRRFSLAQIRAVDIVRKQMPVIAVDNINFQTDSAVIRAEEAEELAALGQAMRDAIDSNPREVFLIEGHTDAVGAAGYNLALSDRRAESLALALTEYYDVPPENMVVQGYGESDLLVPTQTSERANRRAAVRRITPLLSQGS